MHLVDTSVWVEFFRPPGSRVIREKVQLMVQSGETAITDWVILELMVGIRSHETASDILRRIANVHRLPLAEDGWSQTWDLAARLRKKAITPSAADCIIATVAISHGVTLLHCDRDFELIAKHEKRLQTLDWTKLL